MSLYLVNADTLNVLLSVDESKFMDTILSYSGLDIFAKKLEEYNEKSKQQFEEYKKKNSLKQSVIEKYTKLYPNAVIITKDDWSKSSGSFEVIEVKFDSVSYIQFKLNTYKNVEFIYKKYDAEFEKMSTEELLERFSKQEALK
jgi:hypothetical protein